MRLRLNIAPLVDNGERMVRRTRLGCPLETKAEMPFVAVWVVTFLFDVQPNGRAIVVGRIKGGVPTRSSERR